MTNTILDRAFKGDLKAEEELFVKMLKNFQMIAEIRVRDKELAHDIAADSCKTVLEKYTSKSFTVYFYAWAYGIINMQIKSALSKATIDSKRIQHNELFDKHSSGQLYYYYCHNDDTPQPICPNSHNIDKIHCGRSPVRI